MAIPIEGVSSKLLGQARAQSSELEKKARRSSVLLIGAKVANHALRNRAAKRAEEFYKGATPLLNQTARRFETGVDFWTTEKNMLGKHGNFNDSQWRQAKTQEYLNLYFKETGVKAADLNMIEFMPIFTEQVKDELDAHGVRRDEMREFKGTTLNKEARDAIRARYSGSITDMIDTTKSRIADNSSIFNGVMDALNIGRKNRLENIDMENLPDPANLPADATPQERELAVFFNELNKSVGRFEEAGTVSGKLVIDKDARIKLSSLTKPGSIDYNALYRDANIFEYSDVLSKGSSSELNTAFNAYPNLGLDLWDEGANKTYPMTLPNLLTKLESELPEHIVGQPRTEQFSERQAFADDLMRVSSGIRNRRLAAMKAQGIQTPLPNSIYFLQAGLEKINSLGKLELSGSLVRDMQWQAIAYERLSDIEILEATTDLRGVTRDTVNSLGVLADTTPEIEAEKNRLQEIDSAAAITGGGPRNIQNLEMATLNGLESGELTPAHALEMVKIYQEANPTIESDDYTNVQALIRSYEEPEKVAETTAKVIEPETEPTTRAAVDYSDYTISDEALVYLGKDPDKISERQYRNISPRVLRIQISRDIGDNFITPIILGDIKEFAEMGGEYAMKGFEAVAEEYRQAGAGDLTRKQYKEFWEERPTPRTIRTIEDLSPRIQEVLNPDFYMENPDMLPFLEEAKGQPNKLYRLVHGTGTPSAETLALIDEISQL